MHLTVFSLFLPLVCTPQSSSSEGGEVAQIRGTPAELDKLELGSLGPSD